MPTVVDEAERNASLLRTYADRFDHGHPPPPSDHLAMDAHALWRSRGGCPRYLTASAASSLAGVALADLSSLPVPESVVRVAYALVQGVILSTALLGETAISLSLLQSLLDSAESPPGSRDLLSAVLDRLKNHGFEVTAEELSWTNSNGT